MAAPLPPPPRLDDRTWQQLRDELVARIPVHDSGWTDHNASDPGIALLEVFAWLAENLLRRMDRVPDNALIEFLRLLGISPSSASVATALVRLDLPRATSLPLVAEYSPVTPRLQLTAGKLRFSATQEIEILPVQGVSAVKIDVAVDEADPDEIERVKQALMEHLGSDPAFEVPPDVRPYEVHLLDPPAVGLLGAPIELVDTVDGALWIALLVPKPLFDSFDDPIDAIDAVRDEIGGRVVSVGLWSDETMEQGEAVDCAVEEAEEDIRWEVSTGDLRGAGAPIESLDYARLAVVDDTTGGASRTGVVRLLLPEAERLGTWELVDPEGRPIDGMGDLPPTFDDDELEVRVVAWLRMRRIDGPPRRVRWAEVNVVEVEHAVLGGRELLGTGTAQGGQSVSVAHAPVLTDSVQLEVREPTAGWVQWTRVDDLAGSRADDPHYLLDAATGTITFGDGINGRMPGIGEPIRVASYRWGGGARGNVPPGSLSKVVSPPGLAELTVTQMLPATGGADAQSLDQARIELPKTLRHNDRAVAKQDFEDLALATPGAGLGRVEVLPRHLPDGHIDEVPGVVSLVLVPAWDPEHPDEPVPTRQTVRKVCAWLEPRRLVTTELYLLAPEYVEIWVSVAVTLREGYGLQTVKRWVELAVRQHLAPLPPFGPEGRGWPFGRTVRPADVEAAAVTVDGVNIVTQVVLRGVAIGADGVRTPIATVDPCDPQPVPIERWQLPVVRECKVAIGEEAAPFDDEEPPVSPDGWPVPAIRERC